MMEFGFLKMGNVIMVLVTYISLQIYKAPVVRVVLGINKVTFTVL